MTELYAPTLRDTPAEAQVISHKLMLRAGMIRKAAGGIYTYLPLGLRVIQKISNIIREEMTAVGGQEILMPIIQPAELWQKTGRWDVYGEEMFRLKDRHGRLFCLGPTHEEIITALIQSEVHSYKQMPLMLYQIQNKYRDEIRPRFGLMRGREFIMQDLYSFDMSKEMAEISYKKMYDAYTNIFTRCGLQFRAVEADNGAIGGGYSHEFTVLAEAGESSIAYCTKCSYAASDEKAELDIIYGDKEELLPLEKVETKGAKTIESVASLLKVPVEKTIKGVAFQTDKNEVVLAFVRGDHEVNDIKLQNLVGAINLTMAEEQSILDANSTPGYMSPIGIKKGTKIVVDQTVMEMYNAVAGANEEDFHYINVNPKRDFKDVLVADIRKIKAGDICPKCGAKIEMTRGIEAGQVFLLGTKYSKALDATFLDKEGKEQPIVMGCYGIGVGRTMAAAIEQYHDKDGISWPRAIAPYEVVIIIADAKNKEHFSTANEIYEALKEIGVDVILDDRVERAGVKFKDADLIGYPLQVIIGKAFEEQLKLELKYRRTGKKELINYACSVPKIKQILDKLEY